MGWKKRSICCHHQGESEAHAVWGDRQGPRRLARQGAGHGREPQGRRDLPAPPQTAPHVHMRRSAPLSAPRGLPPASCPSSAPGAPSMPSRFAKSQSSPPPTCSVLSSGATERKKITSQRTGSGQLSPFLRVLTAADRSFPGV